MEFKNCFEKFDMDGKLLIDVLTVEFDKIQWSKHQAFEGVELKHLITSKETGGEFSYHLVKIAPSCKIGLHVHKEQLETHEVISGKGKCLNNGALIEYRTGIISIFPKNIQHEVMAEDEGLLLFAKFIPALL